MSAVIVPLRRHVGPERPVPARPVDQTARALAAILSAVYDLVGRLGVDLEQLDDLL